MGINNKKQGFAFTILALFLSFLIFAFGSLYLYQSDFGKDSTFKESRISYLNSELRYFKEVYVKDALKFSFYNTIHSILDNRTLLISLNQDHEKLNSLLKEGIVNGTLDSVPVPHLNNKTLTFFLTSFQDDFYDNFKGNFSFTLIDLNVYEKNPYFLTMQVFGVYDITTKDNISSWYFADEFNVVIPVFGLKDPEFYLYDGVSIPLQAVEQIYSSNINWTRDLFNETLNNTLGSIYFHPDHKYTLGASFLRRMLNMTTPSYKNVIASWSFDYDEKEGGVYDLSRYNNNSEFFGNSRLLLSFNSDFYNVTHVIDESIYENHGSLIGDTNCNIIGLWNTSCEFDGDMDYIVIPDNTSLKFGLSDFSFCFWFKPKNFLPENISGNTDNQQLLMKRDFAGGNFEIQIDINKLKVYLGGENASGNVQNFMLLGLNNLTLDKWHHTCVIRDGDFGRLYLNGRLNGEFEGFGDINMTSSNDMYIGADLITISPWKEYFNGSIDEIALYSKALSSDEMTDLYELEKITQIDYVDSLHGRGIEFDGIDDYIVINLSSNFSDFATKDFTVEVWVKPYLPKGNLLIFLRELTIGIDEPWIYFRDNKGTGVFNDTGFELNEYLHIVGVYNASSDNVSLYVNGKFIEENMEFNDGSPSNWDPDGDGDQPFVLGAAFKGGVNQGPTSTMFNGVFDELKIYNRTLGAKEIKQNYYNYDANAKGCCNYMTLINPAKFGYDDSAYKNNISYSSKVFYDFYKRGIPKYNITVFNLTDITSQDTSKEYYNFLVDWCMMDAYNIPHIFADNFTLHYVGNDLRAECSELIQKGIY